MEMTEIHAFVWRVHHKIHKQTVVFSTNHNKAQVRGVLLQSHTGAYI